MKKYFAFFISLHFAAHCFAQQSAEEYGKMIYQYIVNNNNQLPNEFVDLVQYTSYIDRLEKLPEEDREAIKANASRSYSEVRQYFVEECSRILKLYETNSTLGATFEFRMSVFTQNKNFPDIGLVKCFYIANIPAEEEPLEDAIVFECIKTASGWRILDGFFDAPEIN